jgi:transcriptional regulator with XRE-family HTH domain
MMHLWNYALHIVRGVMSFIKFGQYARQRREMLGLEVEQVAKKMGASRSTVHRIEAAQVADIEATTLYALGKALRWTPEQLHRAYHGKDPNKTEESNDLIYQYAIEKLLKALPKDTVLELLEEN